MKAMLRRWLAPFVSTGRIYQYWWKKANGLRVALHRPTKTKRCCRNPKNLSAMRSLGRPDLRVRSCRVCGCKHYIQTLDPGRLGVIQR